MKKKVLTRVLSVILVIVTVLAIIPMGAVTISAATYIKDPSNVKGSNYTTSSSLAAMLNSVFSGDIDIYSNSACSSEVSMAIGTSMSNSTQYYVKSKTTGNNVSGWQCYIYANAVYNKLFNEWVGHATSLSHSEVVISGGSNTASYEMFQNASVRCGAYMRTTGNSDGTYSSSVAHSMIILSYDSSSITYLEGNGNGNGLVRIAVKTWKEFNSSQLSGRSRYICHVVQPKESYYNSLYYPDSVTIPTYTYYPDKAIDFAKQHCITDAQTHSATSGTSACDDGWLCAEFVSECLVAGGFPKKLSAVAGLGGFAGQITNYGKKISSSKTGAGYVKMSTFDTSLSKGDPIVILYGYGTGTGMGHIVIYSGETTSDGYLKVYAHNARKQNEALYVSDKTVEIFGVHLNGKSYTDNTYSFNFNANGGTLGNTGAFTASYGQEFQILNTTCTRDGYTWAGWNVKRNNDNTWYVAGQGWCTEATIEAKGYSKKIYSNYQTVTLDSSWTNGISGNGSYTFYAVWSSSQERKTMITRWVSEYGSGYNADQATQTLHGTAQTRYYYWFKLYDYYTGDLANSYRPDKEYTVTMNIYDSTGTSVYSSPVVYTNSDVNWCSWVPEKADTYTCEVVVSGGWSGTFTDTFEVDYNAWISLSTEDVSLNLNGTNSQTVSVTACGGIPGAYGVRYAQSNSNISLYWGGFNGETNTLHISGNSVGTTTVMVYIYENYTGNKEIIAEASFDVTVTSNSYTISYNANGGSNAPASQTKTHGHDLTITSAIPTGKTYTVTFNGNGGIVSASSKQFVQTFVEWNTAANGLSTSYPSGSVYSANSSITLYAEWNNPTFSATDPSRSGYYFLGWYDSTDVDDYGLPLGKKYVEGDEISSNLTLYAMWGTTNVMVFGDYNLDGEIDFIHDVNGFNNYRLGLINPEDSDAEVVFRGDVNANGILDYDDILLINQVRNGEIGYTDLPAYQKCSNSYGLDSYPKRTYAYGEAFDDSNLSIFFLYSYTEYHLITENIVVSGYDPYKVGSQTVTISYYQYKVTMTVTVNAPEYSVYYNANGGSNAPSAQTKVGGTNLTLSSTIPIRSGYTFLGWATSSSATTANYQAGGTYSNNANVTLYAVWKADTYTVTYNANGGSNAPASQTKIHGTNLTLSSTVPTRTGYTFMGWATSSNATVSSYDASGTYSNNANVTFYAVWVKNTYTITYNANGGSNAPTIQTKYHGTNITLSAGVPNKEGYTFEGWATSSTATSPSYYPGSSYNGNANITLYAVWSRDTYTVTYNANDGSNAPASQTKIHGTNLTLSSATPTRSGYTFMGWATSSDATTASYQAGGTYSNNANVTLYAVWKADTYTVTYNANGGNNAPTSQTKTHGTNLTLSSATPTRSGYTFMGWATSSSATSASYQAGETYSSNANVTLYAVWKANTYTVTYNANGGSNAPASQTKVHGTNLTLSSTVPTRTGYTFMGWATSSSATSSIYQAGGTYSNNVSVTLYAVWCENDISVPTATISSSNNVATTQTVTLTLSDDSGIAGYYWGANGTYSNNAYTSLGSTSTYHIVTETITNAGTYYLVVVDVNGNVSNVYSKTFYKTTYDANGGDFVPMYVITPAGCSFSVSYSVDTGYTFLGWSNNSNATVATYEQGDSYTPTTSATLYAVWKADTYTVTYDANGGSNAPSSQTKTHGTSLTLSSATPTRTGYTFMGWATSSSATTAGYQAGGTYSSNANVTLYAVWKANTYTVTYNANGGSNVPASQTKIHGTNLTLSSTIPTKTGYTFMGWATSSSATSASYQAGSTYSNNANVTLYAVWQKEHTHTFNQERNDSQYKKDDATCHSKATYYYSCSCGEKGTKTFEYGEYAEHSFSNYLSDNNATYIEDGTKTAKCKYCDAEDTVADIGSALGLDQKFKDEFAKMTNDANSEVQYTELYALLQTYAALSADEKANVSSEFATVQQMINTYNEQAKVANNEHAEATEIAFAPLVTTGFTFLAALWFLLKKKFWI